MIYYFTYFFTKFLSLLWFPRNVKNLENMPPKGAFILASNHISNLDPPILGISTRRPLHYMAKSELFKNPLVGWWLKKLGAFPIKRGEADFGALKEALKFLKKGEPVLVFVEGTRRIGDTPSRAQSGAGFLAMKANAPVLPVYISGSQHVMPPGSKGFHRSGVTITYGKPFTVSPSLSYQQASQEILEHIYYLAGTSKQK